MIRDTGDPTDPVRCEERLRGLMETAASRGPMLGHAVLATRADDALREAAARDALARLGADRPALHGIVLSVKACIDVAGWVSHAGSRVLADEPPATRDAPVVAALRKAGAIVLSQTNMTEFAYSGLGLNPHYGTPLSPRYPDEGRIAGGSSSGGAVTVAVGAVDVALGTDTSGSARIPAAFCGIAGFKPSRGRYSVDGIVPLSPTLDVPGQMARTASRCRLIDQALTGCSAPIPPDLRGARFAVPRRFVVENAADPVLRAFDEALARLSDRGAEIVERDLAYLADIGETARRGGIISAEALAWHRPHLERRGELYDPRVGPRIAAGADIRAADYLAAQAKLAALAAQYHADLAGFDALLTPTVPIEPPRLADLADDQRYFSVNLFVLRFTEFANRIDVPSVTIPIGDPARQGIGLLLSSRRGGDENLLALATLAEHGLREVEPADAAPSR
jgi:aspartyl-tRNA(Asn)/glutamyl-tRNA(Gln) amidotransferase subunit A